MTGRGIRCIGDRLARPLAAAACFGAAMTSAAAPPNVVFFLADDLGVRDLAVYGSSFYETPNLDRLAKEGMLFKNAYSACPVCSPTRAAIQTGRWPQRSGITDYLDAPTPKSPWTLNTKSRSADFAKRLELSEATLGDAFKGNGYATFFAGKWHLGPEGFFPEDQGYDINRGGLDLGGPYGGGKYFSPYGNSRLTDGPPGEHLADRLAQETSNFIKISQRRPFFAMYSLYDVHTPLMAKQDLVRKYEAKRARMNLAPSWKSDHPRVSRLTHDLAVYAAMVETMDSAVGQVLKTLDDLGLTKNTIVVFTSDNGGLSTYHGAYSSPQWAPTSNSPYRAGKGWMYDGGIRVPLIYRWPDRIRAGSKTDAVSSSPDHFPTLMELCGIKSPNAQIDGVSLAPALQGRKLKERAIYWHYPHYWSSSLTASSAIRLGDYKLIEWLEDGRLELFDLKQDPYEKQDLSAKEPGRVQDLLKRLGSWKEDVGAKPVLPNPAFDSSTPHATVVRPKQP